jgi:hypothetical protein
MLITQKSKDVLEYINTQCKKVLTQAFRTELQCQENFIWNICDSVYLTGFYVSNVDTNLFWTNLINSGGTTLQSHIL